MLVAPKYASRIEPRVIRELAELPVPWGPTGFTVYKRTYSRLSPTLGRTEEWHETVERGCNGLLEIGGAFTDTQIENLAFFWHSLKGCPAGRPTWQLGTDTVRKLGGDSLCNCWVVNLDSSIDPFTFAFNQLMLGGGVGYNITPESVYSLPPVKFAPRIERVDDFDCDFIVPDSRDGWVELLKRVLEAFFVNGRNFRYDTRCVRPKGRRINGFGGIASGPEDLVSGLALIAGILTGAYSRKLRPVECMDIMNIIGSIVVSGNVRRSAELSLGDPYDREFLSSKDWSKTKVPAYRQMSNNSVACDDVSKLPKAFWKGYEGNGEPYGLINLPLARTHGRLADGPGYREDINVCGFNPCVSARTWVLTAEGPKQVADLIGTPFEAVVDALGFQSTDAGFFATGTKPLFRVETDRGYLFEVTDNHEINSVEHGWCPLSGLKVGDKIRLGEQRGFEWGGVGSEGEGWLLGHLLGNGCFTEGSAKLDFWGEFKGGLFEHAVAILHGELDVRGDCGSGRAVTSCDKISLKSTDLHRLAAERGIDAETKDLGSEVEQTSSDFHRGFLGGWFDADGTVVGTRAKGVSVRLTSVKLANLKVAQRMLARLGIISTIYVERRPAGERPLPDGRGGSALYQCQATHELVISRTNLQVFASRIGFVKADKASKLDSILAWANWAPDREMFAAKIKSITPIGEEMVYDCTIPGVHEFDGNGVRLHNCAEVPLESHESCNLTETFLPNIRDAAEFAEVNSLLLRAAKAITCLTYSHPKTDEVVKRNRRIGMSVTGYHQAPHLRDAGVFDSVYKHLEEEDRKLSKELGINQSIKISTVKPSGTLSLLAGVTPGVHAAYAPFYIRRVTFAANDPLVNVARDRGYKVAPKANIDGSKDLNTLVVDFPCKTPPGTQCANDYAAVQQLEDQKFLQTHWADNSVSMTCYYQKKELPEIKAWLEANYQTSVKAASFLLRNDHGFEQAPYEEITEAQYHRLAAKCQPITSLTDTQERDLADSTECGTGGCPTR